MKTKIKNVYYCDYCNKHGLSKSKMKYHEKLCSKNPDNYRPCFQCKYLTKKNEDVYIDCYGGSQEVVAVYNLLYCSKRNIFLHTPQNDIKGNVYDLADKENVAMPKECEYFKSNNIY